MFPAPADGAEEASSGPLLIDIVPNLFAPAAVRERIRREVEAEFDALIQQSTGFRRWWLIRKREREISRRLGQIIYGNLEV
jgi:hypothetical protein